MNHKIIFLLFSFFSLSFIASAWSTSFQNPATVNCPMGYYRVQPNAFTPSSCVPFGQNMNMGMPFCYHCQNNYWGSQQFNPFMNPYANPFMPNQNLPWWAMQGQMYYPNMHYPGSWHNQGINPNPYPGNGDMVALKPNIYMTSKAPVKFELEFTDSKMQFLATTPYLSDGQKWNATVSGESVEVDQVKYGYLFYDARSKLDHLQFEAGVCTTRKELVQIMHADLKNLKHTKRSLEDFMQHWQIKIPDFPYYCLYPQYNDVLDRVFPYRVSTSASISRVLYVVVPYKSLELKQKNVFPPLPRADFKAQHPTISPDAKLMIQEWGVAFLTDQAIVR